MTYAKTNKLKEQFQNEFTSIFELCKFVLTNSQNSELLKITLESFVGYLNWVPLKYIFESSLIDLLVNKVFPLTFIIFYQDKKSIIFQ